MARAHHGFVIDSASQDAREARACFEAYRETFAPLVGLEFETIGDTPFRMDADIQDLPEIPVFTTHVGGLSMERTSAQIAADGKLGFALTIVRRGEAEIVQRGRTVRVGAGEAVLTTGADIASLRFPSEVDGLTIMPSRAPLAALVPNLDDLVARPIGADNASLALLAGYAELVHRAPPDSAELRHLMAEHLFDLTALVLGATGVAVAEEAGRGTSAARLARIKEDIETNIAHPGLSIGAVSRRHRISPRYVARLFALEDTNFTDYVRGRRLERARRMLIDPRQAHASIGEIAYECGFNDLSYFNRCFRTRFGAAPGDVRATGIIPDVPPGQAN